MSKNYKRELKPKKALGQHFLKDDDVSIRIAELFTKNGLPVLEIGPGTGALTKHLLPIYGDLLSVIEVDQRSVAYLKQHYPSLAGRVYQEDFLQLNIPERFPNGVNIIGNYPYNISSQIVIKVLDNAEFVPQFAGMFQKEVAQRLTAEAGNKQYGQLTLMREIFYNAEYSFDVPKEAFDPPPKVISGVMKMNFAPKDLKGADVIKLKKMIKMAFLQRRKKMRNSLKSLFTPEQLQQSIFDKRPEQLSLSEFVDLYHLKEA